MEKYLKYTAISITIAFFPISLYGQNNSFTNAIKEGNLDEVKKIIEKQKIEVNKPIKVEEKCDCIRHADFTLDCICYYIPIRLISQALSEKRFEISEFLLNKGARVTSDDLAIAMQNNAPAKIIEKLEWNNVEKLKEKRQAEKQRLNRLSPFDVEKILELKAKIKELEDRIRMFEAIPIPKTTTSQMKG